MKKERPFFLYYQKGERTAYYGKNVTIGDGDAVLIRWKMSDNNYRVIFGDLSIEDVSLQELNKLEASVK